jgi:hypothetical protein
LLAEGLRRSQVEVIGSRKAILAAAALADRDFAANEETRVALGAPDQREESVGHHQ